MAAEFFGGIERGQTACGMRSSAFLCHFPYYTMHHVSALQT